MSWQAVTNADSLRHLAVQNLEVIRNCITLGDPRGDAREDDPQRDDVARLENKLHVLFDMVGMLLAQTVRVPDTIDCVVQRDGMQWHCERDVPPVDQLLRISLYLNRRYPRPLELCARVEHVLESRPARVTARFVDLDDAVGDGLAKIIFREHRREVAIARRSTGAG